MKRKQENWPLASMNSNKDWIDPKPAYQRGPVWSTNHQQLFIDSILRGFDIPKLYLRAIDMGGGGQEYRWEVVDGQQRLKAVWDFYANRFALSSDSDPIEKESIAKLCYKDLSRNLLLALDTYQLSVVILEDADDTEIEEMFIRLQNGVPLNSAEKRNAISGAMRDFINGEAVEHSLMARSVKFPNRRYAHDESVAQMMQIEMHKGPTSLRHPELKQLYETHRTFNTNSAEAQSLKRVMNFLKRAFPERTPELTKVNLISLYMLASGALTKYALSGRAEEFGSWFIDFEQRRKAEDALPEDEREPRLLAYQNAIVNQTANVSSQNVRLQILTEDLVQNIADLKLLHEQRAFTSEQRQAIFRTANRQCQNPGGNPECEGTCGWDNFHADHITPYSEGGPTTVENGQLLCVSCNLKKGARSE